jgi:prephenate dehydrogenase
MGKLSSVALVGTGLIGGSLGMALRRSGAMVRAFDVDPTRVAAAVERGAADEAVGSIAALVGGVDAVVVATPVAQIADVVIEALDQGAPVVTDVGSVKVPILAAVTAARPDRAARFVGGHPMAGSEQIGLDGADADLLVGATWVLTPTEHTDPSAFSTVQSLVAEVGAEMIATTPERHDQLVAFVSHLPQLAASTLMDLAARTGEERATLLRLAAGGFRDMTRIAASDTTIWPDICLANRDAIIGAFDAYLEALARIRDLVAGEQREELLDLLERARDARRNLPVGVREGDELAELRVPIVDRPGALAEITTLIGSLGVNITGLEIIHSIEGGGGVLVLVVTARAASEVEAALNDRGYHATHAELT